MLKYSIINAVEEKRADIGYSAWRIGLTHDLEERKSYWRDTQNQKVGLWADWKADSLKDAQDIEAHFIDKGMKGGTGGDLSAYKDGFVYVF